MEIPKGFTPLQHFKKQSNYNYIYFLLQVGEMFKLGFKKEYVQAPRKESR